MQAILSRHVAVDNNLVISFSSKVALAEVPVLKGGVGGGGLARQKNRSGRDDC